MMGTMSATERPKGWGRLLDTALLLLAVALPFAAGVIPVFILLIALAVIGLRVKGGGEWRRPALNSALPWMALYYLLHVIGMAWSTNTQFGLFDLEVKASFVLFPVLWWLLPSTARIDVNKVWKGFVWANAAAVVVSLVAACWRFVPEWYLRGQGQLPYGAPWTNHFFESRFALFLHPSYMAMYLCFALAVLQFGVSGMRQGVRGMLSALLVVGVILCNSKIGWLTLAVVIGLAVMAAWREPAHRRRLLALSGLGLAVFIALFMAFPTVSGKLTQALSATGAIDPTSDQSSALRRMAWDAATDLFQAQPFTGVGTGDIKDELVAVYEAKGYVHAAAKRMNAHSQFLQSAAALGIPGVLALLAMVLVPLVISVRRGRRPAVAFWLIILLNWCVESMAEVQAGVLFMTVMAWLLATGTDGDEA